MLHSRHYQYQVVETTFEVGVKGNTLYAKCHNKATISDTDSVGGVFCLS